MFTARGPLIGLVWTVDHILAGLSMTALCTCTLLMLEHLQKLLPDNGASAFHS